MFQKLGFHRLPCVWRITDFPKNQQFATDSGPWRRTICLPTVAWRTLICTVAVAVRMPVSYTAV